MALETLYGLWFWAMFAAVCAAAILLMRWLWRLVATVYTAVVVLVRLWPRR